MEKNERTNRSAAAMRQVDLLKARNKRISLIAVSTCVVMLIVVALILGIFWLMLEKPDDGKILSNVYVAGVNLGGMTQDEAEAALNLAIGNSLSTQDMVVTLPDDVLILKPVDTQAFVSIDDLVTAAYQYGRTGTKLENQLIRANAENRKHVIPLLDYMYLDLNYIRSAVNDFCSNYSSTMVQSTVTLKGTRPDYRTVIADGISLSAVEHQTLQIVMGTPQLALDPNDLYSDILDAYSLFILSFAHEAPALLEPDPLDAQELFDLYCVLPEDAYMDSNTFVVTPEIYGYGFDVAELARRINRAEYGDIVTITFGFLYPDITEEDLNANFFKDVLATYTASCGNTNNVNRNINLKVACAALNGTIVKPGESFDFNLLLGPRTTDAGYASAPAFAGSSSNVIGGGISQIASALRYCAMLAGLPINEHHTHMYAVPYSPMGTDAAISYGVENLVFTNNTSDPIQIFTAFNYGDVIVNIMGTQEKDYLIRIEYEILETLKPETVFQYMTEDNVYGYKDGYEMQSSLEGYIVAVYICRYDPETGEDISRTLLETCTYNRRNQIVVRIEQDDDLMDPSTQNPQ